MGRVIGTIVVILVLYAIISNPTQAAGTTNHALSGLASAGQQVIVFVQSIAGSSTSYSQVHGVVPASGVATGDGSYP